MSGRAARIARALQYAIMALSDRRSLAAVHSGKRLWRSDDVRCAGPPGCGLRRVGRSLRPAAAVVESTLSLAFRDVAAPPAGTDRRPDGI